MADAPRLVSPREFFDGVARRYDRDYALSGRLSRERLARVVERIAGRTRVLVLGLGTGRELPALLDAGHEVVGLDVSERMLVEHAKRARTVPVVLGDIFARLPFGDGDFDAVLALHGTLAHPPPPVEEALAGLAGEVARVLRPGGFFVAEVPAAEALAQLAATGQGMKVEGPTSFVHEDAAAGLAIAGVALPRERWEATFAPPSFDVRVEPLGEVEHLVVALRLAASAC